MRSVSFPLMYLLLSQNNWFSSPQVSDPPEMSILADFPSKMSTGPSLDDADSLALVPLRPCLGSEGIVTGTVSQVVLHIPAPSLAFPRLKIYVPNPHRKNIYVQGMN